MNKQAQNHLYSFLYLLALYLGIKLLPLEDWLPEIWIAKMIRIILFFAVCCICVYEGKRVGFLYERKENHHSYFLLAPFLIGCISNLLFCWFFNIPTTIKIDASSFVLELFITLFCVVVEEYLFRVFFISFLQHALANDNKQNPFIILFSSLSFALMHCINFFGNSPLSVLVQIGYTFILGLILGYIALYFERPIIVCVGHFLFNFFNTNLFTTFYQIDMDVNYVLFSLLLGVILVAYGATIYFLDRRKEKNVTD